MKYIVLVEMPISIIELDSSTKEEYTTLILGKNILLKIIEDSKKQSLLENNVVKNLVSIPDLCHDGIRLLVEELIQKEDSIVPHWTRTFEMEGITLPHETALSDDDTPLNVTWDEVDEKISNVRVKPETAIPLEELQRGISELLYTIAGKTSRTDLEIENKKLVSIGNKFKTKTGFEILVPSNLLRCPECQIILSTKEFSGSKKCYICKKEIKREDAERIYIHKVNDQVKNVWERNLWFEAYLARLLRKLDCRTWTGVHVMGASGILHEVDVLAIRDGTVLIAECKTGKVSRNDVFNYCTKIGDLKSHISILALIKKLPEPETREFVKKNPAIIRLENMGKMKEVDILSELRDRLSIKG